MKAWRGVVIPVAGAVFWEAAFHGLRINSDAIAPPSAILISFWKLLMTGELAKSTFETLLASGAGLGIGAGSGVIAGTLLGLFPRVGSYLLTPIEMIRPIPSVALIPLSLMAFGFGLSMEAAVVAFATFWPALILSHLAIASTDTGLIEVARLLHLGTIARITKIYLPAALPRLLTALRLAVGLALVVGVTVEIAANPQGLGYALIIAQQSLRPADMLATLIWLGILGWSLNTLLVRLERRFSIEPLQSTAEV